MPGATFDPLATITLTTTASAINFTSFSNSYTDFIIQGLAYYPSTSNTVMRFNNDSGANYGSKQMGARSTSTTYGIQDGNTNAVTLDYYGTSSNQAYLIEIFNYASTARWKGVVVRQSAGAYETGLITSSWRNNSAITEINLIRSNSHFNTGTTFTIYGIAKA